MNDIEGPQVKLTGSGMNSLNRFSSDSDSSEGGWQKQKRDRRRRPYRGNGARVFYSQKRANKNVGNNDELSESADSDSDSGCAASETSGNARGRPTNGYRGLSNTRRPVSRKFVGSGRGYSDEYDHGRNTHYYDDRHGARSYEKRTNDKENAYDKNSEELAANDIRYSRNRHLNNNEASPSKIDGENPKLRLPPVHHRNLPPRLQKKFGMVAASPVSFGTSDTGSESVTAENLPSSVGTQPSGSAVAEQSEVKAPGSTKAASAPPPNVTEDKKSDGLPASSSSNAETKDKPGEVNFWKMRQEFYRSAQPATEEQENSMLDNVMETSDIEIEQKKQLQHQKDMEQIKQICMEGLPALTPHIRSDIFRVVESQIGSQLDSVRQDSEPFNDAVYKPSRTAPIGTKPTSHSDKPSHVFSQLNRFGRSPHICFSDPGGGVSNGKVSREDKELVYPPHCDDDSTFQPKHSTSLFMNRLRPGTEVEPQARREQTSMANFAPDKIPNASPNRKARILQDRSSFGISSLFIDQPMKMEPFQISEVKSMAKMDVPPHWETNSLGGTSVYRPLKNSDVTEPELQSKLPVRQLPKNVESRFESTIFGKSRVMDNSPPGLFRDHSSNLDDQFKFDAELQTTISGYGASAESKSGPQTRTATARTFGPDTLATSANVSSSASPWNQQSMLKTSNAYVSTTTNSDMANQRMDSGSQSTETDEFRLGMIPSMSRDQRDQTEWIMELFQANFADAPIAPPDRPNNQDKQEIQDNSRSAANFTQAGAHIEDLVATSKQNFSVSTSSKHFQGSSVEPKNDDIRAETMSNAPATSHNGLPVIKAVLTADAPPFVPESFAAVTALKKEASPAKETKSSGDLAAGSANIIIPEKPQAVQESGNSTSSKQSPSSESQTLSPVVTQNGKATESTPVSVPASVPHPVMPPSYMPGYPMPGYPMPSYPMPSYPMPYYPQWPYYPPMPMMMPMPMPIPYWQTPVAPREWLRMPPGMVHPLMQQQAATTTPAPRDVPTTDAEKLENHCEETKQ